MLDRRRTIDFEQRTPYIVKLTPSDTTRPGDLRQHMNKKRVKILLVDDQPANLAVLDNVLADLGEDLVSVGSGEQALRALLDDSFAVVLLDVQMPGMNGFETAALMRRQPRSHALPIIFLTAAENAAAADADVQFPIEQAYALGAVDFITRPFNPVVLRARVSVFIDLYRKSADIESEREQLVDIFQRAPAFMCVMRGPEHRFEFVNQRYLQLVGQRELIGRPVREALPELDGQGFFELVDQVYASGAAFEGHNERVLLRRRAVGDTLEQRFIDLVYIALREADGAVSGVLVHGIDVTARTLSALLAVGQRSALELAVSDAPLGDVLDVLARTAEEYSGGAALAAIVLADGERFEPRLRHAAGPSLPADFMDAVDDLQAGWPGLAAAASGEVVSVDDIAAAGETEGAPAFRDLALAHGLRCCRAIPIAAPSGAVLGVFCWYGREPRAACEDEPGDEHEDEHEALALLANTASLAIGQRHEARQRMAAEDRAHNILESISEGFVAIDGDWRISYANSAAEVLLGMTREQLAGASFWEVFAPLPGGPLELGLRRSAQERSHFHFEAYDGRVKRWLDINSGPTPDGGIALYFRDETERRLAEEGIRRLAAVAEQSPDFIGIATPDAVGMFLNPAGRQLAGMPPDAAISDYTLVDFFAPESRRFVEEVVLPALTGAPARWEGELRFADLVTGAVSPVYFKGFAVRDDAGDIIGLATVTRDITEQKRAEDELRRIAADLSEADHRKSEFLATLAHELRNPLAPIRTGLDLLRIAPPEPAALNRLVGMMDRQLGHLIHLVNDLLDIARITRGKIELKKEPVALATLVSMALETNVALIEASAHRLEVHLPQQPIMLDADTTRIVQVLSNLLNNAAKYTPAGGRITLSAWTEPGQALVAVSDTGVGIPPESLATVFDMFTQVRGNIDRAQGGLGIGLSLVRRLAELHGGSVSAASAGRGHGSTFTLRLPLRPGRA
ncbi:MAG: hypothetical protein JWR40_3770, partial [Massilia sp.]|nr:hypothetical protein [Massilia sp.]